MVMGLLDGLDSPEMGFAFGLLDAAGPSLMPVSFGQGLSHGMQQYRAAKEAQQAQAFKQMQMDAYKSQQEEADRKRQALMQFRAQLTPELQQKMDVFGIEALLPKAPMKLGKDDRLVDPNDPTKVILDAMPAQPKKGTEDVRSGNSWQKYITLDGVPDLTQPVGSPFQRGKDATEVTMPKIDIKTGESVAGQVGKLMSDARIQTQGAVKMYDAADRIEKAVASGLVSAGPGTSLTMPIKQLFVGGSDNVRQTRQVIKSLAQMSVEARKQLQGQGQVTENEAAAVAKADAGDIDDLTIGELQDLVTLTKRAAHYTALEYSDSLSTMGGQDSTRKLVPFFKVRGIEQLLNHNPQLPQIGGSNVDALVKKYGGN